MREVVRLDMYMCRHVIETGLSGPAFGVYDKLEKEIQTYQ